MHDFEFKQEHSLPGTTHVFRFTFTHFLYQNMKRILSIKNGKRKRSEFWRNIAIGEKVFNGECCLCLITIIPIVDCFVMDRVPVICERDPNSIIPDMEGFRNKILVPRELSVAQFIKVVRYCTFEYIYLYICIYICMYGV